MIEVKSVKVGDEIFYYLFYVKGPYKEFRKFIGKQEPHQDQKNQFLKEIEEKKEHPIQEHNVIELLESLQEKYGYLPQEELIKLSKEFGIPGTDIYGVATFYTIFKLTKPTKFKIKVCDGTACHVRGSPKILQMLKDELHIGPNESTEDGLFSIEVVRCLGLCASAPLMTINDELYSKLTPDRVKQILAEYRGKHD